MASQKIINLLDSNGEDGTTIKFETKVIKPNLCDYYQNNRIN